MESSLSNLLISGREMQRRRVCRDESFDRHLLVCRAINSPSPLALASSNDAPYLDFSTSLSY